MEEEQKTEPTVGISKLEKILIAVACGLLIGIIVFQAVTTSTAYPSKVTYVVSTQAADVAAQSAQAASSDASTASTQAPLCVNINTASAEELQQLPGIGPVKAAAIVEYRETNGDFVSLEELIAVKGIGEKTFAQIKEQITLS